MIRNIAYKDKEEWLSIRKNYIGGSEAGALIGLNEHETPYTLWAKKTGRIPEFAGNVTTRVGAYLEELVAKMFSEETGKRVRKKNRVIVNDAYPFACADVDRIIVGEQALLEIKTTNSIPVMRKTRAGEYPSTWYCQMTHYLAVTGFERAYLAVLVGGREFLTFTLERDQAEIDALMEAEEKFWKLVQDDTPPEMDGSERTSGALREVYETVTKEEEADLGDREVLLEEYRNLLKVREGYEKRLEQIKQILMQELGSRERGACGRFRVVWKEQRRETISVEKLREVYPEVDLSKVMKESTFRRFSILENKEEK